jgi:hypothetical protein
MGQPRRSVKLFVTAWRQDGGLGQLRDRAHDPDEIERIDPFTNEIPYDWGLKHG